MARSFSRRRQVPRNQQKERSDDSETLTPRQVLTAFTSLPRVLKLVWRVQPGSTVALGLLYLVQGIIPTLTAFVSKLLIDAVVLAIREQGGQGSLAVVIWLVGAQFGVQALSSLLQTLSNIVQQLLQESFPTRCS